MPSILLIRHSKSIANAEGLIAGGRTNSDLNGEGQDIAHRRGAGLRTEGYYPTEIITSTLSRTQQTATIILEELGITQDITQIPELNERSFGDYDGKPFNLLMEAFDTYGPNPPTVEDSEEFVRRVMVGLDRAKEMTTENGLIVTHVNVLAAIHCALYNTDQLSEFWLTYTADYCEGFTYNY